MDTAQAMQIALKVKECLDACKSLYKERWPEIREEYRWKLKEHKRCNKTSNLLGSAIMMSENQPASYQMVLLWASVDEEPETPAKPVPEYTEEDAVEF